MKVTENISSKTFTIVVTEKEMEAICNRLAFEQGYQEAQRDLKCARLLNLIREALRNYETDWD